MRVLQPQRLCTSIVAATATVVLVPMASHAAEEGGESGSSSLLQEVVVTAQFKSENVQDTPIAITAITAEMLEQRSQTSVTDIAAQAPNVTLKASGASYGPSLTAFIRGVGQGNFHPAVEPGVGMYVDDVYYATLTGSVLDLLDLDRVEVLRGPQGTLTGKNSIGGSIKLFSKKPSGANTGYVSVTYGDLRRTEFRATGDFSVIPDALFVRVSGMSKHRDGYVDRLDYGCTHPGSGVPAFTASPDCKLGTEGGLDSNAARLMLRWLASDAVEVNFSGDVTAQRDEPAANIPLYLGDVVTVDNQAMNPGLPLGTLIPNSPWLSLNGVPLDNRFVAYGRHAADPRIRSPFVTYDTFIDPRPTAGADFSVTHPFDPANPYSPTAVPPVNSFDGWGSAATLDWTLSPGTALKSITAYRRYESRFSDDSDGTPIADRLLLFQLNNRQFSQELRLTGTLAQDAVDYTVGGFYLNQEGLFAGHVNLGSVPNFVGGANFLVGPDDVSAHTKAGFLHLTWRATDKLTALAGLRYSREDKLYTYRRRNPDLTLPESCPAAPPFAAVYPPNCAVNGQFGLSSEFTGSRTDYRAALDYQWRRNFMTYVQYSTGYKGGGTTSFPFVPDQIRSFKPETINALEVGFKSEPLPNLRLNGAAFFNNYKDIQLLETFCPESASPAPCGETRNVGSAHVKGAELEWEWRHGGFQFDGSASYLDFEYTRLSGQTGVTLDMTTPFTPKRKYGAGLQYQFALSGGSVTPRFDYSYQSKLYTDPNNNLVENEIDGYGILNGRLTWRASDDLWQVAFEGTNLTNKLYFVTKFALANSHQGVASGQPALPRQWAITLKRNFAP